MTSDSLSKDWHAATRLAYAPVIAQRIELFYARPFQRPDKDRIFGFQLAPGW